MGPGFDDNVLTGLDSKVTLDQVASGGALEGRRSRAQSGVGEPCPVLLVDCRMGARAGEPESSQSGGWTDVISIPSETGQGPATLHIRGNRD